MQRSEYLVLLLNEFHRTVVTISERESKHLNDFASILSEHRLNLAKRIKSQLDYLEAELGGAKEEFEPTSEMVQ